MTELNFWRAVAAVSALLTLGEMAFKWVHVKQHSTSLILCDGLYPSPSSGEPVFLFDHCASDALVFDDDDQCGRAKDSISWALLMGLRIRPLPWVAREGLIVTCAPTDKVKPLGPSSSPRST